MFWIPRTERLIGLTTNHELGFWCAREPQKIIYGRPDDAVAIRYTDFMWKVVNAEDIIHQTLASAINAAITKAYANKA